MSNRVRPQKITSLSAADKARSKGRKITWIPPNGNGIGYWKGRRQYFENGKIQPIHKNPVLKSASNLYRGAVPGGLRNVRDLLIGRPDKRDTDISVYGLGRTISNTLPVFLQPRVIAAMNRSRKNVNTVGRPLPQIPRNEEVAKNIERNRAALLLQGAGSFSAVPDTENKQLAPSTRAIDAGGPRRSTVTDEEVIGVPNSQLQQLSHRVQAGQGGLPLGSTTKRGGEATLTKNDIKVEKVEKTPVNIHGINEKELKRRTGKSLKEFEKEYRANQVFDTTKRWGTEKGGFFVRNIRGVPQYIPHMDHKR